MNTTLPTTPFKPVSKGAAAELLGVSTKTIDNYIKAGLLPAPRPFGGRELWHPDIFFACLHQALMPLTAMTAPSESGPEPSASPSEWPVGVGGQAGRKVAKDSSPMVRQKQRQAELLSRLNGKDLN